MRYLLSSTLLLFGFCCSSLPLHAQTSPAAALIKLLEGGRIPPERQDTVVKLICQRGDAQDLQYVFERCLRADAFTPQLRLLALQELADAAATRKVIPAGDLARLGELLDPKTKLSPATRLAALRLVGLWKVQESRGDLQTLALSPTTSDNVRRAAIDGLVRLGGQESRAAIDKLTTPDHPQKLRYVAIAALAQLDADMASERAAAALAQGTEQDDPAPIVAAFLDLQGGPEKLGAALKKQKLPVDVAKLCLRYMYSVGRSDDALASVLSDAAGISLTPPPLSDKEINQLIDDVLAHGDPARGEQVFRRADLSCLKCHALNGAGGNVGPDLRDIGTSSPPDYLLKSILLPDQDIKEEFQTIKVLTSDGKILQGIVVDENDQRLVLKDANGQPLTIPAADIEERLKGNSLMPSGLANFMTRGELIDLVRFLSVLGKPGDYAIQLSPTLRRWRVLRDAPQELLADVPDEETISEHVLEGDASRWQPLYSQVSGAVPLAEAATLAKHKIVYLQGELEVKGAGRVELKLDEPSGVTWWLGDKPLPLKGPALLDLDQGRYPLILRIDTTQRPSPTIRVDLGRVGATAQAAFVGGP
ncbi:MAG: HEAT repeat domain-containing protein [Gemmataceae bacterium]